MKKNVFKNSRFLYCAQIFVWMIYFSIGMLVISIFYVNIANYLYLSKWETKVVKGDLIDFNEYGRKPSITYIYQVNDRKYRGRQIIAPSEIELLKHYRGGIIPQYVWIKYSVFDLEYSACILDSIPIQ
ncbi:MAG: hypothetical protein RL757_1173 [Bacteroidota bacterium]|jgi:hypothetical protein